MSHSSIQFLSMRDIVALSAVCARIRNHHDVMGVVHDFCKRGSRADAPEIPRLPGGMREYRTACDMSYYGLALAVEERAKCGLFGHHIEVCMRYEFDDQLAPSIERIMELRDKLRSMREFEVKSVETKKNKYGYVGRYYSERAGSIIHILLPDDVISANASRVFMIKDVGLTDLHITSTSGIMSEKIRALYERNLTYD